MIRVTIELLPGGDASRAGTIGIMDIANIATQPDGTRDYAVALKKTPPFTSPMAEAWLKRKVTSADGVIKAVVVGEDEDLVTAVATGHQGSVYELLYRALRACRVEERGSETSAE